MQAISVDVYNIRDGNNELNGTHQLLACVYDGNLSDEEATTGTINNKHHKLYNSQFGGWPLEVKSEAES